MSSIVQPQIQNVFGVMLSIGIVSDNDRMSCVFPMFTDAPSLGAINLCKDACDSAQVSLFGPLFNCFSATGYISFVAGEGMVDGQVPHRIDYLPTDYIGGRDAGTVPNNCAALIIFYEAPVDETPPQRIRSARNFIPAIAKNDVVSGIIVPALTTALNTLADTLQNGYASVLVSSSKWYRGLAMPKPRSTPANILRVTAQGSRQYVATQRRRLVPH